jgi:hypothetical protein
MFAPSGYGVFVRKHSRLSHRIESNTLTKNAEGGRAVSPAPIPYPVNCPRGETADQRSRRPAFAQLAHFRERANLCFQSLIVLPLDLKFRL